MLGTLPPVIGIESRSVVVGNVRVSREMILPRSTVTRPTAPSNGLGTRISAVSPTAYAARSAISSRVSSFVIWKLAKPSPATQRKRAERAVRPFPSVTLATSRRVPGSSGV